MKQVIFCILIFTISMQTFGQDDSLSPPKGELWGKIWWESQGTYPDAFTVVDTTGEPVFFGGLFAKKNAHTGMFAFRQEHRFGTAISALWRFQVLKTQHWNINSIIQGALFFEVPDINWMKSQLEVSWKKTTLKGSWRRYAKGLTSWSAGIQQKVDLWPEGDLVAGYFIRRADKKWNVPFLELQQGWRNLKVSLVGQFQLDENFKNMELVPVIKLSSSIKKISSVRE